MSCEDAPQRGRSTRVHQIWLEHRADGFVAGVGDTSVDADAGIGDDAVKTAEALNRSCDQCVLVLGIAHIARHAESVLRAEFSDKLVQAVGAPCTEHDFRAGFHDEAGRGTSDAGARPRDRDYGTGQGASFDGHRYSLGAKSPVERRRRKR